jgi:hypothetical protein
MKELEVCEGEIITVSKESAVDIEEGGGVHDGDGLSIEAYNEEARPSGIR